MSKSKSKKNRSKYQVKNWSEYDKSLQQRGSLTFWISEEALNNWYYRGTKKRGSQPIYSDLAIETLLVIKGVYHLPLRQTEGFVRSIVEFMKLEIDVPDHSTIDRRQGDFKVKSLCRKKGEAVHVVVDSTGVKVYGEGEWKVRQHGISKRRTWRKLHFAVDESEGTILSCELTLNDIDDAEEVPDLLNPIEDPIHAFGGDGAYDKKKVYDDLQERSEKQNRPILMNIPPRKDSKIWKHGNCKGSPHPRDENIRYIRLHGRKKWKQDSGYHRRSLSETTVFRYKIIIGDKFRARTFHRQAVEAKIGCLILNRMYQAGKPNSQKIS